jgi:hypothetical protein
MERSCKKKLFFNLQTGTSWPVLFTDPMQGRQKPGRCFPIASLAPASIQRIDGGRLDTSLTVITDDQLAELKKKTGNQISRKELKSGKHIIVALYGYNYTALTLATEVDTRKGRNDC